jgi:dipeptidyl aminopeptidase/acylaminoacyl peptidase
MTADAAAARSRRLAAFAGMLAIAAAIARAEPPPAEAFATLPAVSNVDLSPNGKLLAWADRRNSEQEHIVVFELDSHTFRPPLGIDPQTKLRTLFWSDDDTILFDVSQIETRKTQVATRYESYSSYAADIRDGTTRPLLLTRDAAMPVTETKVVAWRTSKPKTVVMSSWDYSAVAARQGLGTLIYSRREDSGWVAVLFEVDTRSGRGIPIDKGSAYTDEWVVGADARSAARSEWNPQLNRYRILSAQKYGGWREIYSQTGRGDLELQGLTGDEKAVVAVGAKQGGRVVAWAIARDGSGSKVLYEDPVYDVQSVVRDRYSGAPIGVQLGGTEQGFRWLDATAADRYQSVAGAFKDRSVEVYGRSEDDRRVLARVGGPSHPPIYYIVDFTTKTAEIVGEEYPALANATLGEVRVITYKARDGTMIPAYLTLPPGPAARNLPLVVMPHGGPEARDDYTFHWWAQFLATRGYAVLQPQFRGSTGFGDAFRRAGYQQWGLKMQDDITDGVKAMIGQGIADAERICIVGGSYGGYAALAGATFTPDLYKCAVSVNGVSDLPTMLGGVKFQTGPDSDSVAYWLGNIGSAYSKKVIERSPARAAAQIRIPILLMHGVDDTVVPIAQSEIMAHALEQAGRKYTFIRLAGEDHWLSRGETRLQVLTEIEKFLAANL